MNGHNAVVCKAVGEQICYRSLGQEDRITLTAQFKSIRNLYFVVMRKRAPLIYHED